MGGGGGGGRVHVVHCRYLDTYILASAEPSGLRPNHLAGHNRQQHQQHHQHQHQHQQHQ